MKDQLVKLNGDYVTMTTMVGLVPEAFSAGSLADPLFYRLPERVWNRPENSLPKDTVAVFISRSLDPVQIAPDRLFVGEFLAVRQEGSKLKPYRLIAMVSASKDVYWGAQFKIWDDRYFEDLEAVPTETIYKLAHPNAPKP